MEYAQVYLKKQEERRVRAGHLWIYSNEIDTNRSSLREFSAGQLVKVFDYKDQPLGVGYINPHALLCCRLLTRNPKMVIDHDWMSQRIKSALAWRDSYYPKPFYRLIFSEGDRLPGLIVDRFDSTLVIQSNTAGIDQLTPLITESLESLLKPKRIILRNDSGFRGLENLTTHTQVLFGDESAPLHIEENGVIFEIHPLHGQKTGWFYDHRENRAKLAKYVHGKEVLDVFSYIGGWGLQAANFGASYVLGIDTSVTALDQFKQNCTLNHFKNKIETAAEDAFDALNSLHKEGKKFDVIILDPPAFIKRKKDHKQGIEAYHRLNKFALDLLRPNGILVSASCSHFLTPAELLDVIRRASLKSQSPLMLIEQGTQAPDHPIHPAMEETEYLKAFFLHKSEDRE